MSQTSPSMRYISSLLLFDNTQTDKHMNMHTQMNITWQANAGLRVPPRRWAKQAPVSTLAEGIRDSPVQRGHLFEVCMPRAVRLMKTQGRALREERRVDSKPPGWGWGWHVGGRERRSLWQSSEGELQRSGRTHMDNCVGQGKEFRFQCHIKPRESFKQRNVMT